MPHAVLERQPLRNFPAILDVPIERRGHPWRDRLPAKFRIVVEIAEERVGHRQSRGQRVARIEEAKRSVLVGGRRGARGGELNVVVLAGALDEYAEFDGVIVDDFGGVVSPSVHEPGPCSRVWSIVDGGQAVGRDRRKFFRIPLRAGKDERIGEPGSRAVASRTA